MPLEFLRRAAATAKEDVLAARARDPAAKSTWEVVLTYPGIHAVWVHRIAHVLYERRHTTAARVVSHVNRFFTGLEIHPGAKIGRRVFIDHGMGVVIGETAEIGDDCLLYKGVVLGGTSLSKGKRHPTLKNGVTVGSNACILGPIEVGEGARIGSGSVVVRPVPAGATVVGVPGRVAITSRQSHHEQDLEHGQLPDPVSSGLRAAIHVEHVLEERLRVIEEMMGVASPKWSRSLKKDWISLSEFEEGGGI